MTAAAYCGTELEIFRLARNWKAYWRSHIARHVRGAVLEVGAGIGANTAALADLAYDRWLCLEPDPGLAERIALPSPRHEAVVGTTADLAGRPFDTILYLDVLEHIADDREEMARAAALLNPGGSIIVLAPAHNFLYSPFDRAIGHFRRYNRASLSAAAPRGLRQDTLIYLDSCGLVASAGNRLLLESGMPTERQLLIWDRFLVPCSRWLDPLTRGLVGKSILGMWTNSERVSGCPPRP
jgi:SAM-dependent methyltransferase